MKKLLIAAASALIISAAYIEVLGLLAGMVG